MLRFLGEAQSLCAGVDALIDNITLFISPKLHVAQSFIQLLYAASDEELRAKGVVDRKQLIRKANIFINQHRATMQASTTLESWRISIPNIKRRVEKFVFMGLPSPFPADVSVLGIKQVMNQTEELQQD